MPRAVTGLLLVALLAVLYAMPRIAAGEPYVLHVLVLSFVYAVPAVGLNLMLGYTGLVSLGHMAFAGIGAYAAAVMMVDARFGFWSAMALATLAAGAAGVVIGLVCLRFRSHFFMIVTLAFGLVLHSVMNNWDEVTRGAAGFGGIPRPSPIELAGERFSFGPLANFYYLALTAAVLVFALQRLVVRSDIGRILAAIRQDERLARARGVNALAYKTAVFALGSAIAGFGGVLQVSFLRVAAPASFSLAESINSVLIVIVGGAGSLAGPALGALLFVALPEYLRVASEWRYVIFGVMLVAITLFAPRGLAGVAADLYRRFGGTPPERAAMTRLVIRDLRKRYGGIAALAGAALEIDRPGIYGLIGPNGAGKTTLFDIIAGGIAPDSGEVLLDGRNVTGQPSHRMAALGVARTFQECRILLEETCLDNLLFAAQRKDFIATLGQFLSRSQAARRAQRAEAMRLLQLVRLEDYAEIPAANLSFGQRRLLEIVSTFIAAPSVFLLDEPASGVNPALLETLSDFIRTMYAERPSVFFLVEHNMEFIMSLAADIIVMHQGAVLERGTPQAVQASPRVVEAYLG